MAEKTESEVLAQEIFDIENADIKTRSEWIRDNVLHWHLSNNVRLEMSNDRMMWYLLKSYPNDIRYFFKAVPKFQYSVTAINVILATQAWKCL